MIVQQEVAVAAWWAATYPRIVQDLGFDPEADHEAALLLDRLLDARDVAPVPERALRLHGPAVVAGAADTLTDDLAARPVKKAETLIAADGAVTGLAEAGLTPRLVVSDLDGDPERLVALNADGVPVAVHAHGDNTAALETLVPKLSGPVLGTRQTPGPAPSRIVTPGGLGDGDRAVFLAARLGADRIRLVGFDLTGAPGKWSGHTDPDLKRRKMAWSARLLHDAERIGLPVDLSSLTPAAT